MPSARLAAFDSDAPGRRVNARAANDGVTDITSNSGTNASPPNTAATAATAAVVASPQRDWETTTERFMTAVEIDMDHTDFTVVQTKTFDHMGAQVDTQYKHIPFHTLTWFFQALRQSRMNQRA